MENRGWLLTLAVSRLLVQRHLPVLFRCDARESGSFFFNAEPTVREVFRVSGLESLFLFGQNEADAIRILENSQSPSAVNRSEATPTATESTRRSPAQAPLKRNRGNP